MKPNRRSPTFTLNARAGLLDEDLFGQNRATDTSATVENDERSRNTSSSKNHFDNDFSNLLDVLSPPDLRNAASIVGGALELLRSRPIAPGAGPVRAVVAGALDQLGAVRVGLQAAARELDDRMSMQTSKPRGLSAAAQPVQIVLDQIAAAKDAIQIAIERLYERRQNADDVAELLRIHDRLQHRWYSIAVEIFAPLLTTDEVAT